MSSSVGDGPGIGPIHVLQDIGETGPRQFRSHACLGAGEQVSDARLGAIGTFPFDGDVEA